MPPLRMCGSAHRRTAAHAHPRSRRVASDRPRHVHPQPSRTLSHASAPACERRAYRLSHELELADVAHTTVREATP
eukprot:3063834-Prymnesium_polylepis.4